MPPEGAGAAGTPGRVAVHASAVAIDGRALLVRGPSRAGKSRLVMALVAASTRGRPIRFLGDDRILLVRTVHGLAARPHPRTAGFIERRGLGIVAMRHVAEAPLAAFVDLGTPTTAAAANLENFPVLSLVEREDERERCALVLRWWATIPTATSRQHPHQIVHPRDARAGKY